MDQSERKGPGLSARIERRHQRRKSGYSQRSACRARAAPREAGEKTIGLSRFRAAMGGQKMNILEMARKAGLQVLLDARIGSQTYHSVCGSLPALQRFADAVEAATLTESSEREKSKNASKRSIRRATAASARRARRRALLCRHMTVVARTATEALRARAA
jgi:hypothetical protein